MTWLGINCLPKYNFTGFELQPDILLTLTALLSPCCKNCTYSCNATWESQAIDSLVPSSTTTFYLFFTALSCAFSDFSRFAVWQGSLACGELSLCLSFKSSTLRCRSNDEHFKKWYGRFEHTPQQLFGTGRPRHIFGYYSSELSTSQAGHSLVGSG